MGGTISLESEVGKGSTFTVIFPAEDSNSLTQSNNHVPLENDLPFRVGKSKKVLVVDDDIGYQKNC